MIAEVGEALEAYMVFATTIVLMTILYFLGKWWTTYR